MGGVATVFADGDGLQSDVSEFADSSVGAGGGLAAGGGVSRDRGL